MPRDNSLAPGQSSDWRGIKFIHVSSSLIYCLSIVRRHKKPTEGGDEDAAREGGRRLSIYRLTRNSENKDVNTKKTRQRWAGFSEGFGKRP